MSVIVHRLYIPQTGDHLYTSDVNEANVLAAQGFTYEGAAFIAAAAPGPGLAPLHRFSFPNGAHLYATSPDAGGAARHEGIVGFIATQPQAGLVALHQWVHPGLGFYFYTLDPNGEAAPASGYQYQGVVGYVAPGGG
jgi:hypothetical protein